MPPATPQQRHPHGLSAGPGENRALERDPPSSDREVTESVERVYCTLWGRSGRQGHPKSDVIHCIWRVTHQEKAGSPLPLETEPEWARGASLSVGSPPGQPLCRTRLKEVAEKREPEPSVTKYFQY